MSTIASVSRSASSAFVAQALQRMIHQRPHHGRPVRGSRTGVLEHTYLLPFISRHDEAYYKSRSDFHTGAVRSAPVRVARTEGPHRIGSCTALPAASPTLAHLYGLSLIHI